MTTTPPRQRNRQRSWSLYTEQRKPSEYEIVTHRLNYHFRRQPAPFELSPDMPLNRWYLQHREGSPFQVDEWEGFRDPSRLTYRAYVQRQRERELYIDNLIDEFERKDHYALLNPSWVRLLERLYLPSRYAGHILQMASLYVSQMAPSSYITVAFHFQGGDEMRRIQRSAYLAKALSLHHYPELAQSESTRRLWEKDPAWQPMREFLEKLLIAYDWGEAFAALSLVAKPVYDALFNEQLVALARKNNDALLTLMADDFTLDEKRHKETAKALVNYAVQQKPELRKLLTTWVEKWSPLAHRAAVGLSSTFADAPSPLDPEKVVAEVGARLQTFLVECEVAK
jgi:toluene monooxygenase system protein E